MIITFLQEVVGTESFYWQRYPLKHENHNGTTIVDLSLKTLHVVKQRCNDYVFQTLDDFAKKSKLKSASFEGN